MSKKYVLVLISYLKLQCSQKKKKKPSKWKIHYQYLTKSKKSYYKRNCNKISKCVLQDLSVLVEFLDHNNDIIFTNDMHLRIF